MFTHAMLLSAVLCLAVSADVVPDAGPVFSDPAHLTNAWVAFEPGAVRVQNGRSDGVRTTSVVTHLEEQRIFDNGGAPVACRIIEEKDFEDGALVEISLNYLAQDDAGNVYAFGEVSSIYADGVVVDAENDSWLVGGPTKLGDPQDAFAAAEPTMFMPATLNIGDSFQLQPAAIGSETLTVLALDVGVKVPAGKFEHAIKLQELDDGEDGEEPEPPQFRWVVPGVGVVKESGRGMRNDLIATSLTPELPPTAGS